MTPEVQAVRLQEWIDANPPATDHDRRVIDVPDWLMIRATWRDEFGGDW